MASGGLQIDDLQLVDPAISNYSPLPSPQAGVHLTTHTSEGMADRAMARSTQRPIQTWRCWIVQSTRAKFRAVAEQVMEMANNPAQQPRYIQFGGNSTELDGWYHIANAGNFVYRNDFTGTGSFDLGIQKEAASGRNRSIAWRTAALSIAPAGMTAVGITPDGVAPATTVSRTGAEGAVVSGVSLAASGLIQVVSGVPTFTKRVRVFDRNTGAAASTLGTAQLSLTGWTEVYGHDHVFVSDCILTNGLTMVVLAAGSTPAVYNYLGSAWVLTGNPTMANGSTQMTVQSASALQVFSERSLVVAQLAASGFQANLVISLDRGMYHVDLVGEMKQGSGNLFLVSPKNIKLWMSDGGLMDATIPDPLAAPVVNSYLVGQSADTTMTWFPVWASSSLSNFAAPLTVTTVPQASVAVNAYERGMFGIAPLASGNTALYQQEAESLTLVGAGATNVVDAAASNGHAVQCAGTETTEGISFVPGTDGIGVATGITYGVTARVRVDASDAQVCRIETPAATSMTLVTSHTYGGQFPVQAIATTAATAQVAKVLRARYRDIVLNLAPQHDYRLNDTTGTATDSSGFSRNGTYNGGFTQSQGGALTAGGDTDNAVLFNGTTGNVTFTNTVLTGDMSLECWFKFAAAPASATGIIQVGNGTSNDNALMIQFQNGTGGVAGAAFSDLTPISANLATATYHHGVLTYIASSTTMQLYINGASIGTKVLTSPLALNGSTGVIGSRWISGAAGGFFAGDCDEASVYNFALSASQVLALYNAGKALGHLFIDEVGVLPLKNSNNGSLDLYGGWSNDRVVMNPSFS